MARTLGPHDCGCIIDTGKEDVVLFVMDAPNVTGTLAEVIRHTPGRGERVRYDVLMEWLEGQSAPDQKVVAKLFVNRPEQSESRSPQHRWLQTIHKVGFHYFAKPRLREGSDVDEDMVQFIQTMVRRCSVKKIIVASNDAKCFERPLARLVKEAGVEVIILGFYKHRSSMTHNPLFTFVPYKKIPGAIPALDQERRRETP